ncbi:MAG: hypothetical protein WBL35_07260 [Ornithinibacter sp.]
MLMRGPILILLIFVAVVIVLAVVIGFLFTSRARKQESQRVEAAGIRADAEELAATVTGQAAFAEQAEQRAGIVRAEADEKAREAELLESEARARREAAEETRRDYGAQLRRADEIDPDVDDSELPPVEEAPPLTRAERRAAREAEESETAATGADEAPTDYWPSSTASVIGGAGAATRAGTADDDEGAQSARVASAADYRDDVVPEDVYDGSEEGTAQDMSQTQDNATEDHTGEDADSASAPLRMVENPDDYASTEPVPASEQSAPVERDPEATKGDLADHADHSGTSTDEDGGAPVEHAGADDTLAESTEDQYDPTPAKDWAADEGELLGESRERGERLAEDRADLRADEPSDSDGPDGESHDEAPQEGAGRRISAFTELRDGGFGVGSAAPLADGAQPVDHPVQAYRDTMSYRVPGDSGYDSTEPDVWFYDESAAERSGFSRSQG